MFLVPEFFLQNSFYKYYFFNLLKLYAHLAFSVDIVLYYNILVC
jgi:hypothetical protein